ncbi:MAG: hypothetical protein IJA41_05855 [Clostridia bacterium]|nr:hypothetical protein [Clostridia bacterium]
MTKKFTKILSVLLTAVLLLSCISVAVFAEEAYPELKLGTAHTLSVSDDSYVYMTFTPEASGDYAFKSQSAGDCDPDIDGLYYDGFDEECELKYGDDDDVNDNDFYAVYTLTAGVTYTLEVEDIQASGIDFTVTVSKFAEETEGSLELGTPINVKIDSDFKLYTFKPEKDGAYAFYSSAPYGAEADPMISNVCSSDGEPYRIMGETDDFKNNDFYVAYELSADVEYTVCVMDIESEGEEFKVGVEKFYGIEEHPTDIRHTVKMYFPDDVKSYSWHTTTKASGVVTDRDATPNNDDHGIATFNAEKGEWTSVGSGYNKVHFFTVDALNGDVFTAEVTQGTSMHGLYLSSKEGENLFFDEGEDGKHTVTVNKGGTYTFSLYSNDNSVSVKVSREYSVLDEAVSGQTTETLTEFVPDTEYCAKVTYKDGSEFLTNIIIPKYVITQQPTAEKPTVGVNREDVAEYQWYQIEYKKEKATDKTVKIFDFNEQAEHFSPDMLELAVVSKSSYDSEKDVWKGAYCALPSSGSSTLYINYYFVKELKAGDVLVAKLSDTQAMPWLNVTDSSIPPVEHEEQGNTVIFRIAEDGEYVLTASSDKNDVTVSAYIETDANTKKLDGQTTDTLTEFKRNGRYFCEITFNGQQSVKSNIIDLVDKITHQPTANEPFIDVNYPDAVKSYQWYEVEGALKPITKDMIEPDTIHSMISSYDESTEEWSSEPIPFDEDKYGFSYFKISLKAGDKVTVFCSHEPIEWYLWDSEQDIDLEDNAVVDGNNIVFTVTKDGIYQLDVAMTSEDATVKAYTGAVKLGKAIDGQTNAALTESQKDKSYACVVTYDDEDALKSKHFVATANTVLMTEIEKAEQLISVIPEVIGKKDADAINAAKKAYDALSAEQKYALDDDLVLKLNNAVRDLKELQAGSPDTGDSSNVAAWFVMLALSTVTLLGVFTLKLRKN